MVCSPPYPNAFSYHLYHMTRMVWLGMDNLGFKKEEIGSHRKYSKNGVSIEDLLATFKQEMEDVFEWLSKSLRTGRYACFVIGDFTIKGERIDNANFLSRIASDHGFLEVNRIERTLQSNRKAFNPAMEKSSARTF